MKSEYGRVYISKVKSPVSLSKYFTVTLKTKDGQTYKSTGRLSDHDLHTPSGNLAFKGSEVIVDYKKSWKEGEVELLNDLLENVESAYRESEGIEEPEKDYSPEFKKMLELLNS